MIDPGSIARQGYLENVFSIAVDGYFGADKGAEFISGFMGDFMTDFAGDFVIALSEKDDL